jgi:hypothetical protein
MATTDYKFAGTVANVNDSGVDWTNPNNVKATDNVFATVDAKESSNYLRLTNFGFTSSDVPAGATVNGIEVVVKRKADQNGSNNYINDTKIFLRNGAAAQVGDNKASASKWPTSNTEVTYGGGADTWNASLAQTDIVDTDFGLDFEVNNASAIASVDSIKIRITYTESGGGTTVSVGLESLSVSAYDPTISATNVSAAISKFKLRKNLEWVSVDISG